MYGSIALGRVRRGGILSSTNFTEINNSIDGFIRTIDMLWSQSTGYEDVRRNVEWNVTTAYSALFNLTNFIIFADNFRDYLGELRQGPSMTALRQLKRDLHQFTYAEVPTTQEDLIVHTRDKVAIINNIKNALNDLKREIMVKVWSEADGFHG